MSPKILLALKHFARLAVLGAGVTLVAGLLVATSGFNIATLPATYAVFVAMLVPMVIAGLKQAETELQAELAAEEAHNAIMTANNAVTAANQKVAALEAKLAPFTK